MRFHFPELHLDAAESAFVSRELEHVRSQSYDVLFPELKGRSLVPVDNSVDPGAEIINYKQYESVGKAAMAKDYDGEEDAPSADVIARELNHGVFGMKVKYGFSLQEIRNARLAGNSLDVRKSQAARQAVEQKIDEIIWEGEASTGLLGLLNQANTVTVTIPNDGTGSSKLWTAKTPTLILRDLFLMESAIREATKDVESPDTLVVPLSRHTLIATTPIGTASDTTILQFFLKNSLTIKNVEFSHKCETAGDSSTKRLTSYRKDPRKLQAIIPQEFSQLPPQARGYRIVTFCEARSGGVELYYPKSMAYGDGI